ncbi:MAG: hypothetical protein HYU86_01190 [Chloroflexi bacterium]|nr:hypothetical protein [Chloroflexota bacterium]
MMTWRSWLAWAAVIVSAIISLVALYTGIVGERVIRAAASTLLLAAIVGLLLAIFLVADEMREKK